jgi:predicted nucleic acid-binding protein
VRLVVDANILVGEMLRLRGRRLLNDTRIELFLAARAFHETEHELRKRLSFLLRAGRLQGDEVTLFVDLMKVVYQRIAVMPLSAYEAFKETARRRIPRDQDDWHTIALALALDASIWTMDGDFLGCGIATWTTDTLLSYLDHDAPKQQ